MMTALMFSRGLTAFARTRIWGPCGPGSPRFDGGCGERMPVVDRNRRLKRRVSLYFPFDSLKPPGLPLDTGPSINLRREFDELGISPLGGEFPTCAVTSAVLQAAETK